MISINSQELETLLEMTPSTQNIMLVGKHGIGKSQVLTNYFEGKGMKVVTLFLGQMADPGDLIGLPTKDEATGKTNFLPPYWFPTDGKPVVLFLDELNRARPELLQTVMDLALNRKLAGRALPEGSRLISAVNEGQEYTLTDMDPALVSRFNVYEFRPTPAEWLLWAAKQKLDNRVIAFIQNSPEWLDGDTRNMQGGDTGMEKTPDRRAWHKVCDIMKGVSQLETLHKKVIAGIVGPTAAAQFAGFVSENNSVSGSDILFRFKDTQSRIQDYQLHQFSALNEAVLRYIETQRMNKKQTEGAVESLPKYLTLLEDMQMKEALAHFASLMTQPEYKKASAWIATNTPDVYVAILDYIDNI